MDEPNLSDISEKILSVISLSPLSKATSHSKRNPLKPKKYHSFESDKIKIKLNPKKLLYDFKMLNSSSGDLGHDLEPENGIEKEEEKEIKSTIIKKSLFYEEALNVNLKNQKSEFKHSQNLNNDKKTDSNKDIRNLKKFCEKPLPILASYIIKAFSKVDRLPNIDLLFFKKMGFHISSKKNTNFDKTLFLDLDGTLIHKKDKKRDYSELIIYNDCIKKIFLKDSAQEITEEIIIRPYSINFIKKLSNFYELIVYTASGAMYASEVVHLLDPTNSYISQTLSRGQCVLLQNKLLKDLRLIKNRKIEKCILLENKFSSFYSCINNGIFIKTFYGDCQDSELKPICKFLEDIKNCEDVREEIKKKYRLEEQFVNFHKKKERNGSVFRIKKNYLD